jgi:hypothetical protein
MAADPHEPAFAWDDSQDDSLVSGNLDQGSEAHPGNDPKEPRKNPLTLAVFGGLYAVWSLAWVLGVVAAPTQPASSLLDAIMYQFGEFLAIIATPLTFGVLWWLTRSSSPTVRAVALGAGLLVLVPLPLILPVVLR